MDRVTKNQKAENKADTLRHKMLNKLGSPAFLLTGALLCASVAVGTDYTREVISQKSAQSAAAIAMSVVSSASYASEKKVLVIEDSVISMPVMGIR